MSNEMEQVMLWVGWLSRNEMEQVISVVLHTKQHPVALSFAWS